MKQVLVKPLWDMGLKGKLFDPSYQWSLTPWSSSAAKLGIALNTWDMVPLDQADCVWLLDLPDKKSTYENARRRARPGVPFVLQVMESPTARAHNFEPANHALFDYVVTYQQNTAGKPNHFSYRLPNGLGFDGVHMPFEQRRCSVMINSNRVEGFLSLRNVGLVGLPGIGRNFSGWKMPFWCRFQPARGELYSWRRKLARTAEATHQDALDVVGWGWSGERISWLPVAYRKPYRCCKFKGVDDKLKLASGYRFCIGVENYRGTHDYISEKIFDPLLAGSVPVYLGDENITKVIPKEAFVDVRNFHNHRDLLNYLYSCPKAEWTGMYEAGQAFLKTETVRSFSHDTFVREMNGILVKILGMDGPPESKNSGNSPGTS